MGRSRVDGPLGPFVSPPTRGIRPLNPRAPMAENAAMAELTVVRWKRYGKDRLYVNTDDGTRVGWLDQLTGESTVELEDLRAEFDLALRQHLGVDAPKAAVAEAPWTDLSLNHPGEAV